MRPYKCRKIEKRPDCNYFKPRNASSTEPEKVLITLDEVEAMRLSDYEGLYQEKAAARMNISRQTFGRIIESGRKKIIDALLHGKAIFLSGGEISIKSKYKRGVVMKIIAAPLTYDGKIDDHFGHCEYFGVYSIGETNEIISLEKIESPQSCGCRSGIIRTLADKGVEVMLCGNMGDGAVQNLAHFGIKVVRGCSGEAENVVKDWLAGKISDAGVGCAEHRHHHGGFNNN